MIVERMFKGYVPSGAFAPICFRMTNKHAALSDFTDK